MYKVQFKTRLNKLINYITCFYLKIPYYNYVYRQQKLVLVSNSTTILLSNWASEWLSLQKSPMKTWSDTVHHHNSKIGSNLHTFFSKGILNVNVNNLHYIFHIFTFHFGKCKRQYLHKLLSNKHPLCTLKIKCTNCKHHYTLLKCSYEKLSQMDIKWPPIRIDYLY